MSVELLLEIGCEEIPAKFTTRALAELPDMMTARLAAARLTHSGVSVMGTPRRLAIIVRGLAETQPDLREEVVGPPVGAAFGPDGAPTKAGIGFAQKNGVDPATLTQREVPGKKGLYAVAQRHVVGQATRALLPELCAGIVGGIAWPKSMRWGWGEAAFVRPVQWLVAIYGGEVVPFSWGGVTAGRNSYGHRFLAPGAVEISSAAGYVEAMRRAFVIVDPEARRNVVVGELSRLERSTGLKVRPDDALIDEVVQLGEYPVGVCGQFDPAFLTVPEEVIVTTMRNNQRYFAMEDGEGKLAPRFVTMMATVVKEPSVVENGNQFVLASRLSDARFFFTEDQKKSLSEWGKKLDHVVFQAKLGEQEKTTGRKIQRITQIAERLATHISNNGGACDIRLAKRAAELCKCDLATGMVGEFPELQGVMGMHYARLQGEPEIVASAIAQHYLPKGQGSDVPSTAEAAVVALADRLDTLVGCFSVGVMPSGSADPFGLRRAAIGILQILLAWGKGGERAKVLASPLRHESPDFAVKSFPDLEICILAAQEAYSLDQSSSKAREDRAVLEAYFEGRLRGLFIEEGLAVLDVHAVVTAASMKRAAAADLKKRACEVAKVPEAARQVFKRIANILDNAGNDFDSSFEVDASKFESDVERNLWSKVQELGIAAVESSPDYAESFDKLRELGPTVAAFFDKGGVMVMVDDYTIRHNRLALLNKIYQPFNNIVDFRILGASA